LHAQGIDCKGKSPVLRLYPICDQRVRAWSWKGSEERLNKTQSKQMPKSCCKTAHTSSKTPTKTRSTKQVFPVKKVGEWSREQNHEGINDGESVSLHQLIVVSCEVFNVISDAVVFVVHLGLVSCVGVHKTYTRSLQCVSKRYHY